MFNEQRFDIIIDELARDFEKRFSECRSKKLLFQFTINPFSFPPDSLTDFILVDSIAASQLALLELQSDPLLCSSAEFSRRDCLSMWKAISEYPAYRVLCDAAKKVLSMFGGTYRCESAFSAMKGIKSKERNRITDENLIHCVRAATTKYQPLFKNLVSNKQCQGSH